MKISFENHRDKDVFEYIEFSITRFNIFSNKSIFLSFYLLGFGIDIEFRSGKEEINE